MRKSIFDIEFRIDKEYEFESLKSILFEHNTIYYHGDFYSLFKFLNDEIFPTWKYKGMFIDLNDFCYRLDIDWGSSFITQENFLYLLELLINLWIISETKISIEQEENCSKKVLGYMRMNLPTIVEKMNYQIINDDDKYRIIKRNSDVDSVLDIVPDDCSNLLLDYNDIRNNSLMTKKSILKDIDLYIENNKKSYQGIDKDTYNSIQIIVNKMGINHPIKEEPYKSLEDEEIMKWYDKCFKLMIHLIRTKEINKINKERKSFIND